MKKAAEALEWLGIKSSPKDAGLLEVPGGIWRPGTECECLAFAVLMALVEKGWLGAVHFGMEGDVPNYCQVWSRETMPGESAFTDEPYAIPKHNVETQAGTITDAVLAAAVAVKEAS